MPQDEIIFFVDFSKLTIYIVKKPHLPEGLTLLNSADNIYLSTINIVIN
jgi:hypothetical protein